MAGIDIGIGANTNDFERGIKQGVVKPLDGVEDVLKDVTKAGDKAGEQLEDSMKEAADATEKNEKANKDLAEQVKKVGRAGKDSGDDFKKGTDRAKDGIDEVGREAESTAKEAAASFDGSAESIGDAFQEVAANAFAGFGPAGVVAGVVAAAGIGAVFSAIEQGATDTEAWKEKVGELSEEFIAAGGVGETSLEYVIEKLKEMATETDEGVDSLADLQKQAESSASGFEKIAQAYAGNTEGLDELIKKEQEHLEQLEEESQAWTDSSDSSYAATVRKVDDQAKTVAGLKDAKKAAEEAALAEKAWVESGGPEMELKADLADGVAEAYDNVRDAALDAATSEEGVLNVDQWAAEVAAHKEQVIKYQENLSLMKMTPEQWANFMELPESSRMTIAASWASGGEEAKSKIVTTLTDAGTDAAAGATVGFNEGFNPEGDVEVTATVDTSAATEGIAKVTDKKYEADIKVTTSNKANANDEINKVADKKRTADIKVNVLTGDATEALSNFINKKRSLNITVNATDANGKKVY